MKRVTLFLILIATLTGCGQSNKKAESSVKIDETVVNVFYFHGKQRCKTCIAVQDVARETIEKAFATAVNNPQSLENLIKEEINKRLQ